MVDGHKHKRQMVSLPNTKGRERRNIKPKSPEKNTGSCDDGWLLGDGRMDTIVQGITMEVRYQKGKVHNNKKETDH